MMSQRMIQTAGSDVRADIRHVDVLLNGLGPKVRRGRRREPRYGAQLTDDLLSLL